MRADRIDRLEAYILEQRSASLDQLCQVFGISKPTLRRDLEALMPRRTIEKVYGGVVAIAPKNALAEGLTSFSERNIKNADAKARVARLAADTIEDNDVIFIDTGTSTLGIAEHLAGISNLTVITNSLLVASKLLAYDDVRTIMLPGTINTRTASAVGDECQKFLRCYHIRKAFMACSGVSGEGVFNNAPEEYAIKRTALEQSALHCLLLDSSKFDRPALMAYASLDRFHWLFSDEQPPEPYVNLLRQNCVQVKTATD